MPEQTRKICILFLHFLALATARGTKGGSTPQWNPNPPQTKGTPLGGWDDEVNNPQGGFPEDSSMWKIEDSIPGVPGQSYPSYDKVPQTSFDCRAQGLPGYYADMETQCQVFHICQADGRQNSFLCPLGTVFNQETFVCDWWFNVICADTSRFTSRNSNLYKSPFLGIDGQKTKGYGQRQEQGSAQDQRSRKGHGGNIQSPGVGIPNAGPQIWNEGQQGTGNMKGDGNDANQPEFGKRVQVMGNRPSRMDQVGGQNSPRRNPGTVGSGPRRQNAWNQRPRGNEKGRNHPGGPSSNPWNQMGRPGNANRMPAGGTKGEDWNPRRSMMQGNHPISPSRGQNQNKGFDANRWSLRPQNFQDRARSGDDWNNNMNSGAVSQDDGLSRFSKGQQNRYQDSRGSGNNDGSWRNEEGSQWNGNTIDGQSFRPEGRQGYAENGAWYRESRFGKETSWRVNNQRDNHAVDYDY